MEDVKPIRIQRKRTKGWRMPEGAIDVTRSGAWGNPFVVNTNFAAGKRIGGYYTAVPTVEDAVECFRIWASEQPDYVAAVQHNLRGKNLACWCPLVDKDGKPIPCHADVLLEIANR